MPHPVGSIRLRAAFAAMAASTADPPACRMSIATCEASSWLVAAIPLRAKTGLRVEKGPAEVGQPLFPLPVIDLMEDKDFQITKFRMTSGCHATHDPARKGIEGKDEAIFV